jgi:type II secretory pathway pseudopilin PulG
MKQSLRKQGVSDAQLLILLTAIVIVLMLAIPQFLKSRLSGEDAETVANLKLIHQAQQKYFAMTPSGYYGDLVDLSRYNALDPSWNEDKVTKKNYTYSTSRGEGLKRYCAKANSSVPGEKDFGIDTGGGVYEAPGGNMTCENGEIGGLGVKTLDIK